MGLKGPWCLTHLPRSVCERHTRIKRLSKVNTSVSGRDKPSNTLCLILQSKKLPKWLEVWVEWRVTYPALILQPDMAACVKPIVTSLAWNLTTHFLCPKWTEGLFHVKHVLQRGFVAGMLCVSHTDGYLVCLDSGWREGLVWSLSWTETIF